MDLYPLKKKLASSKCRFIIMKNIYLQKPHAYILKKPHGFISIKNKKKKVWKVAPFCIFWTIWRKHNQRAFKDKEQNDQMIKLSFLCNLSAWIRIYLSKGSMPLFLVLFLLRPCFRCSLYTSCVLWCTFFYY